MQGKAETCKLWLRPAAGFPSVRLPLIQHTCLGLCLFWGLLPCWCCCCAKAIQVVKVKCAIKPTKDILIHRACGTSKHGTSVTHIQRPGCAGVQARMFMLLLLLCMQCGHQHAVVWDVRSGQCAASILTGYCTHMLEQTCHPLVSCCTQRKGRHSHQTIENHPAALGAELSCARIGQPGHDGLGCQQLLLAVDLTLMIWQVPWPACCWWLLGHLLSLLLCWTLPQNHHHHRHLHRHREAVVSRP